MNWLKKRIKMSGISYCVSVVVLFGVATYLAIPSFTRISKTLYFEKTIATETLNLSYDYNGENFTAEKAVEIYINPENAKEYILAVTISCDWFFVIMYLLTVGMALFFFFGDPKAEEENDKAEVKQE